MPKGLNRGNSAKLSYQLQGYLNDLDGRNISDFKSLSRRIDLIVAFLQLEDNTLGLNIVPTAGDQFLIGANTDVLIDISSENTLGLFPPTLAANIVTIHSPGLYQAEMLVGMDTGSAGNAVLVEIWIDGVFSGGVPAGVEQAAGQGSIAVQSNAGHLFAAVNGTTVEFRASATDALANIRTLISGGYVGQIDHDWDAFIQ
jgi:hypothetical protein